MNELMLTKVVLIKLWHVVSYERIDVFMLFITYETEGVCRRPTLRHTPHACCSLKRDGSYERI